jgi:hypothetical protein
MGAEVVFDGGEDKEIVLKVLDNIIKKYSGKPFVST